MSDIHPARAARETIWSRRWHKLAPYVFISPYYILFLVFGAFPIAFSLVISFTEWSPGKSSGFVGLRNYQMLLTDKNFHLAVVNTLIVNFVSLVPMIFLAMVFAVVLDSQATRFRQFFRMAYFSPAVTSLAITGLVFGMVFHGEFGLVNKLLSLVGIQGPNWVRDPIWTKPLLITLFLWRWTGNDMMYFLAGLQSIPSEIYEAAKVDGASAVQTFFRITIPYLRPIIMFDVIISMIGMFDTFEEAYVLWGRAGGPSQSALVTGVFLYRTSFFYFKFGYGAAVSYVLGAIIFALSFIQLKVGRRAT